MHDYGLLSSNDATKIVNDYDSMPAEEFKMLVADKWEKEEIETNGLSDADLSLRNILKSVFDEFYAGARDDRKKLYQLDLQIGLKIFGVLNPEKTAFSLSDASNDDLWRYISLKIIPDLTYLRYPPESEKGAKNINKKRFFSDTRRIWIKTLWWYVFLSWQGSEEKTFEVLKNNATDNINKLIETPGRGYRLSLYRQMMREYAEREHKTKYFAGVTKLNNAKCKTLEPSLLYHGEAEYVRQIFDEVPVDLNSEDTDDVEE